MSDDTRVRPPAVAGSFYPAAAARLQAAVDEYLGSGPATAAAGQGAVRALIVPHAGYSYSGTVAGRAYATLRGRTGVTRVVVLAPTHRVGFRGVSVGRATEFATPLGNIAVDTAACADLQRACPSLVCDRDDAQAREHAVEVQLPFVQTVLPQARLVPVVCGELAGPDLRHLAAALATVCWSEDTLWVVSSDFTHYGAAFDYVPFTRDVPRRLEELDRGAIDRITQQDVDGFLEYVGRTGVTICGATPIAVLLATLADRPGTCTCRLLEYTTSGAQTADYEHCVSYASLEVRDLALAAAPASRLDAAARRQLLGLAREAIRSQLDGDRLAPPAADTLPPALAADGAAFVTLTLGGRLRGCIGDLEAYEPLWQNVVRNARCAASQDPRFLPLAPAELPGLHIEISAMGPMCPVRSPQEIVLGRHGILLAKSGLEAVFLPQVPGEQGWDLETTLRHLARKAGLRPDDWRQGCRFSVFEAEVFGEDAPPA